MRGFACWPGDGELSDAGRVEETKGFDKAVATETRVVAGSAVNGDGGIVGGLAVNLNPGADCSAVGFRANEFDLEPVATMAGVLEERVLRLVAGRRPAEFAEEVEIANAVVVQEGGAQTPEGAAGNQAKTVGSNNYPCNIGLNRRITGNVLGQTTVVDSWKLNGPNYIASSWDPTVNGTVTMATFKDGTSNSVIFSEWIKGGFPNPYPIRSTKRKLVLHEKRKALIPSRVTMRLVLEEGASRWRL